MSEDRLVVLGYVIARRHLKASWIRVRPEDFPFDSLERWGLEKVSRQELATVVAAFGHFVRSGGDITEERLSQMAELERKARDGGS